MSATTGVLVAVGGATAGDRAVETGARLAKAFGTGWHAIHIETPRSAGDPAAVERAGDALARAAKLGATVSREPAISVARGLKAHLANMPADHLVLGTASTRSHGLGGSTLRDVLADSPELSVHLVPSAARSRRRWYRRLPWRPNTSRWPHALAVVLVLATVAICELLRILTGGRPLSLLFIFPVVAVAARAGLGPSLLAVVLSVFGFDLLLLAPRLHLEPFAPVNILLWLVLGPLAIYTSAITGALRSRVVLSDRSAQESARIVTFAQSLIRVSSWSETAQVVCDEIAAALNVQALVFREAEGKLVCAGAQPPHARIGVIDRAALDWCWAQGEEAGAGTKTAAAADWRFEPLKTSLGTLAVLAMSRSDGRDPVRPDRKVLFATLVSQAALAHERLVLEDRALKSASVPARV